ncbi:aminotransferase class I and II [Desulfohalobium retbaense DSM 5692]|uniref:Aminotransferase n=1 Tax=Desulfohalobium retbaense (strain ATCC 49708 / DSM 5692 / JCM 16813 / HR100) TaxID=485915 RepID=C8X2A9_DESRD|nr:aminotransferase class I and II [Desulfohalobium retbaense DSM 5692]
MIHPASCTDKIRPFLVMDVLEAAHALEAEGHDIVHLEIGEPDFDTPDCVKEAANKAISDGQTHYTHSLGVMALREAICEDYHTRYGVSLCPEQIVVTSGTSPAMLLAFGALLEPGEEVLLPDPGYACYPNFVHFVHGEPKRVRLREADGFQLHPDLVREAITPGTRAMMVNSPSNPAGTVLPGEWIQELAGLQPALVADEIYHGLVYGEAASSVLEHTEDAFVLNGFSKLYAMTGWRLGYLIAPQRFMRAIQKLAQNLFICAGSVAQHAAIAALRHAGPDVERMRQTYDTRRQVLLQRLQKMGFTLAVEPKGAFYVFVNASHLGSDSYTLAFDILHKAHVGVTPGIDFGPGGEGYLRFSYANSLENIEKGMDRLEAYIQKL